MDLRKAYSLTKAPVEGDTKATPENYLRLAKAALEIIRALPPDVILAGADLLEVSLQRESFERLFAGCEVNRSRKENSFTLWVYIGWVKVKSHWWDFDYRQDKLIEWTEKLPETGLVPSEAK